MSYEIFSNIWEAMKPFLTFTGGVMALAGTLVSGVMELMEHHSQEAGPTPKRRWMKLSAFVLAICGGGLALFGSQIDSEQQALLQEEINRLTRETLTWVTGGAEGFIDIKAVGFRPDKEGTVSFLVSNNSTHPVYDVSATFTDMEAVENYWKTHTKDGQVILTGTVSALVNESEAVGSIRWNRAIMYPEQKNFIVATFDGGGMTKRNFTVDLYTRNGFQHMKVLAAKIGKPNMWAFAYKIQKKRLLGTTYADSEKHDPDFPVNAEGKVEWPK